jgi:hypothetical protein
MARHDNPDLAVVFALCRGARPPRPASYADRLAAIRHLAGLGYTDPQIGVLVGKSARTVLRVRTAHGIAGVPVGTNGRTRVWSVPVTPRRKPG